MNTVAKELYNLSTERLSDKPNWGYLLREFDNLYRSGSAGGSKLIRAHRKRVREGTSKLLNANAEILNRQATEKPVCNQLQRVLDISHRGPMVAMARALQNVAHELTWEYGYEKIPASLAKKYAYCEIAGPRGPIKSTNLILGFVLFAPNTTYPQHSHHEIEESYISIGGAWSENDLAVHAPGSLILNHPGSEHRITTADQEPCLLAYAWVGPEERLHENDMKLTRSRKARMTEGI